MMLARISGLELRAVHGRAGRPRHRRHRADVVEVSVGEQDRLDGRDPERLERAEQPLGLVAGSIITARVGVLAAGRCSSSPAPARP